ncbi:MAG: endonuclease III [Thermomicrobiales bacterium]|nr:endonuclease III [Thermomicrobiales bacterium]
MSDEGPETIVAADGRAFPIDVVLERVAEAVRGYPAAAMFDLADRGFRSVFEQLVACVISVRTRDEVTLPVCLRLFAEAATPQAIAALDIAEIDRLIALATFHEQKAPRIRAIAQRTMDEFGGELPCDFGTLTSFAGVGPKCANLTLGVACGKAALSVDIHVHRVTNRWGLVATQTPEETMRALERVLPERYWVEINRLLVPFGKHICTGTRPWCSHCPVLPECDQVGVINPR